MKTGLTLGKYSPLHAGHQMVIETALREMDHLIVIIYNSPETTRIPLEIRAEWIRKLYPDVEVIEAWDGPVEVGNTPRIRQMHEQYLLNILKLRKIDAFYSSEFYGEHVSTALNAENRLVDMERKTIPISGSRIRNDAFRFRSYLTPEVYRDHVINVVFMGAPGTGKTTLAQELARTFRTCWMPEYGREYWEKHQENRRLSQGQLIEIAQGHVIREERLLYDSRHCLFTDTNAITTYMFGKYYHNSVLPELEELARKAEKRYDLFFLCGDDIPYEATDTWDRSGEQNRRWFQQQIEADLRVRKIPFITLQGSLPERLGKVRLILDGYGKFESISNGLISL